MTQSTTACWKGIVVLLAGLTLMGCWPASDRERMPLEFAAASLLEAYPYAQGKAAEWSPTVFLEGASAQYKLEGSTWKASRVTYVFVDSGLAQYTMVVMDLGARTVQIHRPRPIEGSMVSMMPFFLEDNPVDERQALRIADDAVGDEAIVNCRNLEVVLKGNGVGENQYWGVTYAGYEPVWKVVAEVSIDAGSGQVVSLRDFTSDCQQ